MGLSRAAGTPLGGDPQTEPLSTHQHEVRGLGRQQERRQGGGAEQGAAVGGQGQAWSP